MKRSTWIALIGFVCALGGGYVFRGDIRDAWSALHKPVLPVASRYAPKASTSSSIVGDQNSPVEGGTAKSQHFTLVSSPSGVPARIDPFANNGPLPIEANLDVPFTSQAPKGDWSLPYQEACEEASAIMVDAFYRGISGTIPPDQATRAINALVAYEQKLLGAHLDTDAADTAKFIKGYFQYDDVVIAPLTDVTMLKRAVANGFPVIVPADGKLLPNPNFRNGGPIYHMVVVKGYTRDRIITNDPGTRNGADFVYTSTAFMNAAHDWNVDAADGAPVMIIVIPTPH